MSDSTPTTQAASPITIRSMVVVAFVSISLGLFVALLGGDERTVSVESWFASFALGAGTLIAFAVVRQVPVQVPPVLALWRRTRTDDEPDAATARPIKSAEHLILRTRDNERAFASQLRPRLRTLAKHNLRIEHGIDLDRDPERADAVLGDVAWLLDPAVVTRRPTVQDLDDFLNRIEGERV